MIGLFIFVVYAVSAWYVLKQLPSRRAKTIVWAIVVLTWGPALFVAFAPPSPSQPGAEAAYIGKFVEVLLAVGLPLMPLTAIGLGIARIAAAPQSKHIVVGITVFFGFFLLFADEIAGRIYLNHLCTTEAGVKVYQTVELPAEHWEAGGRPKFFNKHGYLEHNFWVKELDESGGHVERYSSAFFIDKDISPVKERTNQKVLAEITTFRYWGGWVRRNFSPHNTANSCEFIADPNFSRSFYGQLFKPAISSKEVQP